MSLIITRYDSSVMVTLTSMFSCNVKNGCNASVEWSPSRCKRERNSPRKMSLKGDRPKSVDRVTVPLFLLPINYKDQIIVNNVFYLVPRRIQIEFRKTESSTCHSSPSSALSPFTSPFGTTSTGFSTSFFS